MSTIMMTPCTFTMRLKLTEDTVIIYQSMAQRLGRKLPRQIIVIT